MTEIRTLSDLYPREWLSPADLKGRQARVVVAAVEIRTFRRKSGGSEAAVVLSFVAQGKPCALRLICNRTQARAMAEITGSEVFQEWVGATVMLATATAPNGRLTIAVLPAEKAAERGTDGEDGAASAIEREADVQG